MKIKIFLRACLKIVRDAVFVEKAVWRGATKDPAMAGPGGPRHCAFSAKTLRAAALLPVAFVGSVLAARFEGAWTSPPRPWPKSLAAAPLRIFRQALIIFPCLIITACSSNISRTHRGDLLDDKVTAQRVQAELSRAGNDFKNVHANSTNGVVVLAGSVR